MQSGSRGTSRLGSAAAFAAMAALVVVLSGLALLRAPIPLREGHARLRGLSSPAEVKFDRRGTPHVRAATEQDAYRVLGWLHAGDRLFQMETRRRTAAGRLSESMGAATVRMDERARTLGIRAQAEREFRALSVGERRLLEAYASGVNAYVSSHPRPWELVALGIRPEPWTALDSLRFLGLMFTTLSASESVERANLSRILRSGLGPLLPVLDAQSAAPTFVPPEAPYPVARGARLPAGPGTVGGSNAWAVSGLRTASGRPILANDPHLEAEMPGVWYAAHLVTADGLDVAGLTMAGIPGIVIGHNGVAAWGLTMHQADDADLFLERLDETGERYEAQGRWLPVERSVERIGVKGGRDVEIRLARTRHGPVVEMFHPEGSGPLAVSLAWSPALDVGSLRAFLAAARARTAEEIAGAWSLYRGPSLNVCWATADGRIGLLAAGAVPRRKRGDGRLPVPGWTGSYDWDGLVPQADLPRIEDPPEGFVASANDDWTASGVRLPYPGDYAPRERVDRIREVLASLRRATPSDIRVLQNDVLSLYAVRVRDALLRIGARDPEARRALVILAGWDGRALRRGPSLLFYTFMQDLRRRAFGPREERLRERLPAGWDLLARMIGGTGGSALWDDPGTDEVETREAAVSASLAAALRVVEAREGAVPAAWSWGRAHALSYVHPFAEAFPALGRLLNIGPIEMPGDSATVAVSAFSLASRDAGPWLIVSARLIVDLGDPDGSRLVLPLGESGQFGDPRRDDQAAAWAEGRDFPFPFRRAAVDAAAVSTLRLE